MAKRKNISIDAKRIDQFKVEVKAGERIFYLDQPKYAGGTDAGPNPLECFLSSLAGCIATTARIVAKQEGIELDGLDLKIDGEFDPDVLLGNNTVNRPGLQSITVKMKIHSDQSNERKEKIIKEVRTRCPIFDNILNVTPVIIALEKKRKFRMQISRTRLPENSRTGKSRPVQGNNNLKS